MNTWQERKRLKQREKKLRDNINYRQNLREVNRSEKSIDRLYTQYTAQAVEAERSGNHALAIRLAGEAARLKKHQTVTGNMRGSLEIAHAVQNTNQAVADILEASRNAVGSLLAGAAAPDVYAVQADMTSMQEHVQDFMEQSEMFYEDFEKGDDEPVSEENERYLRTLIASQNKEKQRRLLQDTNSRLEKLQRNRPTENEGSKQA